MLRGKNTGHNNNNNKKEKKQKTDGWLDGWMDGWNIRRTNAGRDGKKKKKRVLSLLWTLAFIFYRIFLLFENLFSIYLFGALLAASVGGISRGLNEFPGNSVSADWAHIREF